MTEYVKDPSAIKDYTIDWGPYLASNGSDTIATSTWSVPAGLTEPNADTNDTTTATVWLGSGTLGERYTVTNEITTAGGRTDQRSIVVCVEEL